MPRIRDWYSAWKRLKRAVYQQLFEFQEKAIAAFIKGMDVLVKAPTNFIKSPPQQVIYVNGVRMRRAWEGNTWRIL